MTGKDNELDILREPDINLLVTAGLSEYEASRTFLLAAMIVEAYFAGTLDDLLQKIEADKIYYDW